MLGRKVTVADLNTDDFDEVIIATGIAPRLLKLKALVTRVLSYLDVLRDKKPVGRKVAAIGAGGIGFDVSEYLCHQGQATSQNIAAFMKEWGI